MNVLILSPHTDDAELGAGGTLARLASEGANIRCLTFSWAGNEVLKTEAKEALAEVGVKDFSILDFERRKFHERRQDILQILYDYNQEHDVDTVFVPSSVDLHQDHQVVTEEALRAFKKSTILGYELAWNNIRFTTSYFVRLSEDDVTRKLAALGKYQSQKSRTYFKEDFIRGLLRVRGTQIQTQYAESFEVIRVVY